ncbi:MAG TPA: hypothetical protein VNM92_18710 [Thermoanaerobaculia bacterium]|nr:hypothetical protein [Thermoanaerobaculia bacterium]
MILIACLAVLPNCSSDSARRRLLEEQRARLTRPARSVIVIPGFGVTGLYDPVANRHVWGRPSNAVRTRYIDNLDLPFDSPEGLQQADRLIPKGFVGSRGPINVGWQLVEALRKYGGYTKQDSGSLETARAGNIFPFYYDWRLSASENARYLDRFIDQVRHSGGRTSTEKVDLVAHSAGGLVVETYLKLGTASPDEPLRWSESAARASSKVDRAILISTPLRGTVDAFRVLNEEERFLRRRFSIDIVATFRSLAELLPWNGQFLIDEEGVGIADNLLDAGSWKRLQIGPYHPDAIADAETRAGKEGMARIQMMFDANLRRAATWRNALNQATPSNVPILRLAGDCVATTRLALLRHDRSLAFYERHLHLNEQHLAAVMFEPGDGSVSASSAGGTGQPDARFCDGHQGIASDPNVHQALIRYLLSESFGIP